MSPPFEPLGHADLKLLTVETMFFLSLVSGNHRREIHALSMDLSCLYFAADCFQVTLRTDPTFKKQYPEDCGHSNVVPALSFLLDGTRSFRGT